MVDAPNVMLHVKLERTWIMRICTDIPGIPHAKLGISGGIGGENAMHPTHLSNCGSPTTNLQMPTTDLHMPVVCKSNS